MDNKLAIRNDMSLNDLGQTLVKSGFFADTRDAAQAVVKVLAGRELGLGPIASMTGINVIQGRISLSANLIAAAIKRSGRYNFRVRKMENTECTIEYFEGGESIGVSTFTLADAQKAGTKNLDKFPRNMLFARAMSNGARWYCPDVFSGPVYTPEEMGAEVNEDGEVIDVKPAETHAPEAETTAPARDYEWAKAVIVVGKSGEKFMGQLDNAKLDWVLEHGSPEQREAAAIVREWNEHHPAGQPEIL